MGWPPLMGERDRSQADADGLWSEEREEVSGSSEDVCLAPAGSADTLSEVTASISASVLGLYDVYSYGHAATVLKSSFPTELSDIEKALMAFRMTLKDIAMPGGNESTIPPLFAKTLRPLGWLETRIRGDLVLRVFEQSEKENDEGRLVKKGFTERPGATIHGFVDGYKIDYVKGKVALDVEWNSKDQTYDRDLYAFRAFHECRFIDVAVLITRSEKLNPIFNVTPLLRKDGSPDLNSDGSAKYCKQKYGASTTWMGKLLYRLNAGRQGGCPVLVFGMRPELITDW